MTFCAPLKYNEKGYSEIIYTSNNKTRYRIIKNPSLLTRIYYLSFTDRSNNITVKLYPWDS